MRELEDRSADTVQPEEQKGINEEKWTEPQRPVGHH